jgi:hypothetical protein
MMKRRAAYYLLALVLVVPFAAGAGLAAEPTAFTNEQEAQQHCPADTVVWLNLPTGIYHLKGERWYGRTTNGAYVCEKEADRAGDRLTRNGQ